MPYNTRLSRRSKKGTRRSVTPELSRTNPDALPRIHKHNGVTVAYHLYVLRSKKNKPKDMPALLAALEDAVTNPSFLDQLLPAVQYIPRTRICYVKIAATE